MKSSSGSKSSASVFRCSGRGCTAVSVKQSKTLRYTIKGGEREEERGWVEGGGWSTAVSMKQSKTLRYTIEGGEREEERGWGE